MAEELDTCTVAIEVHGSGAVMVRDEFGEEIARYGIAGDRLSAFPGMAEDELDHCGRVIALNTRILEDGKGFFFGFTPAGGL